MLNDLKAFTGEIPKSSSTSCTEYFYEGCQSKCCPSQCRPCCINSMINDHTYSLLKRICRKIIKDYNRQQCREKYTIFDGGNSVNVRIHRSSSTKSTGDSKPKLGTSNSNVLPSEKSSRLKHEFPMPLGRFEEGSGRKKPLSSSGLLADKTAPRPASKGRHKKEYDSETSKPVKDKKHKYDGDGSDPFAKRGSGRALATPKDKKKGGDDDDEAATRKSASSKNGKGKRMSEDKKKRGDDDEAATRKGARHEDGSETSKPVKDKKHKYDGDGSHPLAKKGSGRPLVTSKDKKKGGDGDDEAATRKRSSSKNGKRKKMMGEDKKQRGDDDGKKKHDDEDEGGKGKKEEEVCETKPGEEGKTKNLHAFETQSKAKPKGKRKELHSVKMETDNLPVVSDLRSKVRNGQNVLPTRKELNKRGETPGSTSRSSVTRRSGAKARARGESVVWKDSGTRVRDMSSRRGIGRDPTSGTRVRDMSSRRGIGRDPTSGTRVRDMSSRSGIGRDPTKDRSSSRLSKRSKDRLNNLDRTGSSSLSKHPEKSKKKLGRKRSRSRRSRRFLRHSRCDEIKPCDILRAYMEERELCEMSRYRLTPRPFNEISCVPCNCMPSRVY